MKSTKINLNSEKIRKARNQEKGFTMIDDQLMLKIISEAGGNAFAVYMYLLNRLNHKTGVCNPSIKTIEADTGISDKTVRTALKKLKESNFIDWEQAKAKNNSYNMNYYYFLYSNASLTTTAAPDQPEASVEENIDNNTSVDLEKAQKKLQKKKVKENDLVYQAKSLLKQLNEIENKRLDRLEKINGYRSKGEDYSVIIRLAKNNEKQKIIDFTESVLFMKGLLKNTEFNKDSLKLTI